MLDYLSRICPLRTHDGLQRVVDTLQWSLSTSPRVFILDSTVASSSRIRKATVACLACPDRWTVHSSLFSRLPFLTWGSSTQSCLPALRLFLKRHGVFLTVPNTRRTVEDIPSPWVRLVLMQASLLPSNSLTRYTVSSYIRCPLLSTSVWQGCFNLQWQKLCLLNSILHIISRSLAIPAVRPIVRWSANPVSIMS